MYQCTNVPKYLTFLSENHPNDFPTMKINRPSANAFSICELTSPRLNAILTSIDFSVNRENEGLANAELKLAPRFQAESSQRPTWCMWKNVTTWVNQDKSEKWKVKSEKFNQKKLR